MKKVELICVGELKSRELKVVEREYLKKIGFFTKLEPIILKDIDIQDETVKKKKESRALLEILDKLDKNDFVVALDEKGKQMDSLEFSRFLAEKFTYHPGRIVFLLGGHAGL
ncbi:MAG: 23S rRNA (pseudouridine(1915)-N(3))-methyltransferase RlmH, partial [Candidatus Aminicenantes bacterium]|nr:23S rRNA (pseudouridine(1915)-N(3))-methyltransferase RlmH [Candidatus Aminicenantes bacterium]